MNMKRHIILTALVAATLAAVSCTNVERSLDVNEGLFLIAQSGEMNTKAYDPSFENRIDHFDFFFFEDKEGTRPIRGMHARVEGDQTTLDTRVGKTYYPLRSITSYVYIIANYGGAHPTGDLTLQQLLALPVSAPLMKVVNAANGQVQFPDNLVMDSWDETNASRTIKVSPQAVQDSRTITVPLRRLSVKLALKLKIAKKVAVSAAENWTPIITDLKANFVNSLNNHPSLIEPTRRPEQEGDGSLVRTDYVSYPEYYPITQLESETDFYVFQTDPVLTYPQVWSIDANGEPYFKVSLPWISNKRGSANFYYKVTIGAKEGDITLERNNFYTFVAELAVLDTENDYTEVTAPFTVAPWVTGTEGGNIIGSAEFFKVPVTEYDIYSDDSIEIPFNSDSQASAKIISIDYTEFRNGTEYTYHHTPDAATFSVKEPANATTQRTYSVEVDDALKMVTFTHDISNLFLSRTVVIRITKNSDPTQYKDVTIIQHPSIEFDIVDAKDAFVNGRFGHLIQPAIAIDEDHSGETFGLAVPISNRDKNRLYENSDNVYASYFATSDYNGESHSYIKKNNNIYATLYVTSGGTQVSHEMFLTKVAVNAFNESNDTYKTYEVTAATSADALTATGVEKEYTYRIGDPRVKASTFNNNKPLAPYLTYSSASSSGNSTVESTKAWESPGDILITSTNADNDCNIISPWYMFSSNMNMVDTSPSFEEAIRRGETYQDSGYPAGRWRLPTEAEIAFVVARQLEHVSPVIFKYDQWYWTGNGSVIRIPAENSSNLVFRVWRLTEEQKHSSTQVPHRFVYDLWYWGAEAMNPTNRYYPNMHEH